LSYTRLGGGELSAVEIASLSGDLRLDSEGTINTPLAIAAISETLFGQGADLISFLADLIPDTFLGDGRYSYGNITETRIPKALDGSSWQPDLINVENLSKKDFAKTGLGLSMALVATQLIRQFGLQHLGAVAVVGANAKSRSAHRASVMAALKEKPEIQAPNQVSNSASIEVALEHFMAGFAQNNRSEIMEGIKVLRDTK